ncbi:MAG: type IV fimbrial biogenesis protein FimT [Candidatus Endobugula sp.]|jgi:type IV fimbrial biogenesis protein FimT
MNKQVLKLTAGFTLIKLLVTVSTMAILVTVAAPYLLSTLQHSSAEASAQQFHSALRQARVAAFYQASKSKICSSTDGISCANNSNWSTGYVILVDAADDASFSTVIYGSTGLPSQLSIFIVDGDANNINEITFSPLEVLSAGATEYSLSIVPDNCEGSSNRSLTMTSIGKLTQAWVACPS